MTTQSLVAQLKKMGIDDIHDRSDCLDVYREAGEDEAIEHAKYILDKQDNLIVESDKPMPRPMRLRIVLNTSQSITRLKYSPHRPFR